MKVVAISDTHMKHKELVLPHGDVIVHAGDYSGVGNQIEHHKFTKWFGSLPYKHKLFTPGNHDGFSEEHSRFAKEMAIDNGCTMLIDEEIIIEGKKLYFSPWTPMFYNWWWMLDRGERISRVWENIPKDLDILVTHGPPYSILDLTMNKEHVGCEELIKEIYIKRPKHHVFGHIHYCGGLEKTEEWTNYHNAAVCGENYKPTNRIVEFQI